MSRIRNAIYAASALVAIGALLRQKWRALAVAGDTAWITVVVAGLSGKLQTAADWLNANVGTWSFLLGVIGLAASLYTKRRILRAAEAGKLSAEASANE